MKKVMLVGGGKIGIAITEFLSSTSDYKVTVVDRDAASLQRMPRNNNVEVRKTDILSAGIPSRGRRPGHRSFRHAL
ncbi:MAG: saccharopine dehydrogenase NADP-binding domain-containing protein [Rhizomicrobium sp.]